MKKFILMFIVFVSSFIFYTYKVNALVYNGYKHFTDNYVVCTSGYSYCQDSLGLFTNKANGGVLTGTILFNFISDPQILVNQVVLVNSNNTEYACNLGTNTIYRDNTTGYTLFTATCPVSINDGGISSIRFLYDDQYYNGNSFKFYVGDFYSFYVDPTDNDYSNILLNIYNSIYSLNSSLGGKLDNIYYYTTLIYNQVSTTNNNLQDIKLKLDSLTTSQSQINNSVTDIKNDLKDSSIDNNNTSSSASDWSSKNATNGTITNLLTLPISLLQNILNGIQSSCSNFSLGTLFGTELNLPCINLSNFIGNTLFNVIDLLFSGFMILNISKKLIKIFNDFTNLKSNQIDEIYSNGGGAN